MATSYLKMGEAWFAKAQFDKAAAEFKKALKREPFLPSVHRKMMTMAESRRQFNESIAHALTALRLTLSPLRVNSSSGAGVAAAASPRPRASGRSRLPTWRTW